MWIRTLTPLLAALLGGCVIYEDRYATPGVDPVQTADVLSMRAAGAPENRILDRIQTQGVARKPTADDVAELKLAGVPDSVLHAMIDAPVTVARPSSEVCVRRYDPEPFLNLGAAAVTGYLIARQFRH